MIRHVVLWKFRPGTAAEQTQFITELEGLQGVIPQLRRCEVFRNGHQVPENFDAILVADFDSLADLNAYKEDPRHQAVSKLCQLIRLERAAVDLEC